MIRDRAGLLILPLAAVLAATGVAWAFWTAGSVSGGSGAAAATTVNQGATPSASGAGSTVTVSWAASTLATGQAVAGYRIKRYDAGTSTAQTILSSCTGTITILSCVENAVPVGSWKYTVTPVFAANWQGAESAQSATVTVAGSDTTAPVNAISLSNVTGYAAKMGTTVYYRGAAAGSFTLTNAVSDSGSGPASSQTAALTGGSAGWTHNPSTVSAPAGGPYMSNTFSWTAGTTSAPTEVVTGRDVAGNTAGTTLSFVNDSAGPSGGSVDASGLVGTGSRYSASTTLNLDLAKGTDPNGVAATGAQLLRATAPLTSTGGANGVCGSYGSYSLVAGGNDPATPKADTVADQACYSYRYVVSDTLGNPTTYTSPDIKVDTTAPGAPSLAFSAFTNSYWSGAGSTVYYRSAASAGSFTATASASDPASGIASYDYPPLGANWSSTPGGTGVRTYSWTGSPAAPGTKSVTATNHAAGVSTGAPFTPTADDTAPSNGTVSYPDTTISTTSVSVSFTTGTDTGSGVGTRLLQRASATLTNGTCGTYGAYSTLANGTNPTSSPVADTVSLGNCYQYRYIVTDNVGNQHTASSANVVKVSTYFDTILSTTGLVDFFRLGEATTSSDSLTGTTGATLQSRNGEISAVWTKHPLSGTTDAVITNAGRVRKNGNTSGALYYSSATPASADYTVEADVRVVSLLANSQLGVVGRLDPAVGSGTFYAGFYSLATQRWTISSVVNGVQTVIGQSATNQPLTAGTTYRLSLDMTGSTIRVLVNGTQQVSVTSTTITSAGRAGLVQGFGAATTTVTDAAGMHLDNFAVTPQLADSKVVANNGDYFGGPTLGATGAIARDSNSAATFDGVNDFGSVTRQVADDLSVEFWFKSTQGIGTGTSWTQGAGLVDADTTGAANDFGVSLRSDGRVVAGVGNNPGTDTSIVSSSAGYNNGSWHHVVFTRTKSSGALNLYVDGVAAGSATGGTASLTSTASITLGRIAGGTNYFAGSLDEVTIYNAALPPATVTAHHSAAQ